MLRTAFHAARLLGSSHDPTQLAGMAMRALATGTQQTQQHKDQASSRQHLPLGVLLGAALGWWAAAGDRSADAPWISRADARQRVQAQAANTGVAATAADVKEGSAQQQPAAGLPEYSADEVAEHSTVADRIWVTYKDGVYDITEFVAQHPGGPQKIMLAAGGSIEPFWQLYQLHNKQEVRDILSQYRVGTLKGGAAAAHHKQFEDPWKHEPRRHPALLQRSSKPFNAETPPDVLAAALHVPSEMFYVRAHLPVPEVDAKDYTLKVEGDGLRALSLSLPELQSRFKHHTIDATVECGGNRRKEMKAIPAPGDKSHHVIKGLDWDAGAIGNARWHGVLLRDVLQAAGLQEGDPDVAHIHFEGLDTEPDSGTPYAASIPVEKALSPSGDVLLAWEMNGQPLSRDHGAPLRVVVPGHVGARSVKYVGRIIASGEECQSHWQQKDYKAFSPGTDWDSLDWSTAPAIQEMPVVSAICEPAMGQEISTYDEEVKVRGYAWSGGGRGIIRVDVTPDNGTTWHQATLERLPQRPGRQWAWTLWEATVPLPKGHKGPLQLAAKATDTAYNTQPENASSVWNVRGMANNSWHRVDVTVC